MPLFFLTCNAFMIDIILIAKEYIESDSYNTYNLMHSVEIYSFIYYMKYI